MMDIYTIYIHDEPNDHVRVLQSLHEYIPEHQKNCLKTNVFSSTSPHQVFQQKKHGHINDASPHPTCFKKDSFNIQEAFHLEDAFQTNPNRVKSSQVKGR